MKRIVSFLLILSLIFSFGACKGKDKAPANNDSGNPSENQKPQNNEPKPETIVVPAYKDYGRGSVDFTDITYSRPDMDAIVDKFQAVTALVNEDSISSEEQVSAVENLEEDYYYVESMYAIIEIFVYSDASVNFWQNEFEYMSISYPLFTKTIEDLLVACAASVHRTKFENEYFGYSLEEYRDGGIYTDELVELMQNEAMLEAEYTSLSTDNVVINYKSVDGSNYSGTVDEVLLSLEEKFGKGTSSYNNATIVVNELYNQQLVTLTTPIYLNLLKTRRLIADELGYESYTEFAYRELGYDFSKENMSGLVSDIGKYVEPLEEEMYNITFSTYFKKNNQPQFSAVSVINTLYKAYSRGNDDLTDAYSYMLQHGLFNIGPSEPDRYSGAFATYIYTNNSPYLFATTSGFLKDFSSITHEFGHFYDGFVNNGARASLDLLEVSSQAMQMLSVLRLRNELKLHDYEYLEYLSIYNILNNVLLYQSFFSAFEHLVYQLEYDEITLKNVNEAIRQAYMTVYNEELIDTQPIKKVLIYHTIVRPHYVDSYVVSVIPSLELFAMESYRTGTPGAGMAVYKELISRDNCNTSFEDTLAEVGLSSPFETSTVKKIANSLYYQILGKNYYTDADCKVNAA